MPVHNQAQAQPHVKEMAMVTMANYKGIGLTPAAMELQPAFYPTTNASQVTSDDPNNSHHDDNSHLPQQY